MIDGRPCQPVCLARQLHRKEDCHVHVPLLRQRETHQGLLGCALLLLLSLFSWVPARTRKARALSAPGGRHEPVDLSANPTTASVRGTSPPPTASSAGLQFNGSNCEHSGGQGCPQTVGMSALTIEAWVLPRNVASHTASAGMSIVSKRNANLDNDAYNLFVYTGRLVNGRVNHINTAGKHRPVQDRHRGQHLVPPRLRLRCKATGTERLKLYVNGVLESSTTHPATAVDKSTAPLWVGELDAAADLPGTG